jgi:hypothetical protein
VKSALDKFTVAFQTNFISSTPGEGSLDHPALRDDYKLVQLIALGHFHGGAEDLPYTLLEPLAGIAAID